MLLTEYDEKKVRDYLRREAWEDGWEDGRKAGEKHGRETGEKQGRKDAAEQINRLNRLLISEGRYEDLKRASEDTEYQRELFEVYGIKPRTGMQAEGTGVISDESSGAD